LSKECHFKIERNFVMKSFLKLPVDEYATPSPITISEDALLADAMALITENEIRHIPVVKGETIVGIVSERDMEFFSGLIDTSTTLIKECMTTNPFVVKSGTAIEKVAMAMSDRKIGSAIIVDDDQRPTAIFTVTDALNALIEVVRGDVEVQ